MRTYKGGGLVPGVPARDLTEEEWDEHVKAGRIVEGQPSAALWEKHEERRTPRATKAADLPAQSGPESGEESE